MAVAPAIPWAASRPTPERLMPSASMRRLAESWFEKTIGAESPMANEPRPVRPSSMTPAWIWTKPLKSLAKAPARSASTPFPVLVTPWRPSIDDVIRRRLVG